MKSQLLEYLDIWQYYDLKYSYTRKNPAAFIIFSYKYNNRITRNSDPLKTPALSIFVIQP